jgi:hypothetical protein
MINTGGAQHFRAPALHEAQIIGVINDASGVGVFKIDAQGQAVHTIVDGALGGQGQHVVH